MAAEFLPEAEQASVAPLDILECSVTRTHKWVRPVQPRWLMIVVVVTDL